MCQIQQALSKYSFHACPGCDPRSTGFQKTQYPALEKHNIECWGPDILT